MITRNLLTRSYKLLLTLLVLLMSTNAFAQRLTATGKVTDAAGLEVIGASVLEKGTANGVVTNLDGEFSLSVGQNATLVISFIGYKTIEVKATTNMNITLQEDNELLDEVVNKVWHLDAQLGQIDMYSLGWKAYLHQRVVDEERRRREREVAEKKADRLMKQGIRLHAKATKAVAAQNMMRRAEKLLENTSEAQKAEKVADIRFPEPAPCGRTPIMAKDISKAYGSNIVFAGVNLAIDKGSRVVILGYNGAGKTTTLRLLARDAASIRAQGELLLPHVAPHYPDFDVRLEACQSQIGSGSLPVDRLPSAALTFTPRDGRGSQLDALSARWRALPAPVIGRIYDGRMWLDLRCLEDEARFLEMLLK